ncbi:MAG TPA: hypothetical protein VIG90_15445, partial [Pedomonas sp.]|uniref:hypothetical protein n=1 Tax=Pedomonas sp. TaxID=2976421 RepID=UPI002F42F36A
LTLMPGAWIYLTPTLAIYMILRRVSKGLPRMVTLSVAAIPPLAAGFGIPWWANGVTEERVEALLAQDHGAPPILPAGLSITHAVDRGLGSPGKCWDTCQRLLFSRTAKSFIEVPLDQLSMRASLPTPARRFSLGPIGPECNNARLQRTYATREEIGREVPPPPPLLSDKLKDFAQEGLCLHDDAVRDVRSDVLIVERWNYDPAFRGFRFEGEGWRLSLHPIAPFKRREVFQRTPSGLVRLMRHTEVRYARLAEPLWLSPGLSLGTARPTHWAWRDQGVVGRPIKSFQPTQWNGRIANDLTVHGLR